MISVCGHYELGQLLHIAPLVLVSLRAANHIFQLHAIRSERLQVIHGEDLVKALLEGLSLNLQALMEYLVHGQIYIVLQVVKIDLGV